MHNDDDNCHADVQIMASWCYNLHWLY